MSKRYLFVMLVLVAVAFSSCSSGPKKTASNPQGPAILHPKPAPKPATPTPAPAPASVSTPYLTPSAEAKTFDIRDGYRLELVLSDPVIKEPVLTVFDGNGRMFVSEMRTYMQDIDGHNQLVPKSCVSVHWSSKHNGVYDKHAIYADNLILPRMILPLDDGVLITETGSDNIWLYHDTKGNGVADKKELFHAGGGRGENLEHQSSGLIWDLDNWLYATVNAYRLRLKGTNHILQEPTAANMGQWGLCQDDYGKPIFSNAGYESGPVNFQEPIVYGAFHYEESTINGYHTVWPLVGMADYQGGSIRIREGDHTLNHFTATCGQEIYRGDRLPTDLRGDLLFGEPVGRLVRRTKVEVKEGYTYLRNAYEHTEFIRSTDANFRPVNVANAPDGTLYITDMYRGIIQESGWVNQGSYLRGIVEKNQMEKNFGRGRIWRLVHSGAKPGPQPHMLAEKPAELVKHLEHPNGWWRDTAQKLLVLRGDKSVAPALVKMATSNPSHLARIHAIWTLEGLDSLEPELVREKLKDTEPQVRIAALRASETLYKAGDHSLVQDLEALAKDSSADVVIQVALTANLLKWPGYEVFVNDIVKNNPAHGVQVMVKSIAPALPGPPAAPGAPAPTIQSAPPAPQFTASEKLLMTHGEEIYKQLCFACHGMDGKGTALAGAAPGATMAPPLSGSKTATGSPDAILSVVLKGLSGPVNGRNYDAQMVPMQSNDDEWIAAITSFIRNSYENHAAFITTNEVARVRASLKNRTEPWTIAELLATLPQPLTNRAQWKLTASHNSAMLHAAVDGNAASRYDTHTVQVPGMWVQIELPEITEVSEVILDTANSPADFPQSYKVELSTNGESWGEPVATGKGAPMTQIDFPTASTKFIRITQTGSHPSYFWSIHELQVLRLGHSGKVELAQAAPTKPTVVAPVPIVRDSGGDLFNIDPFGVPPPEHLTVSPMPAPVLIQTPPMPPMPPTSSPVPATVPTTGVAPPMPINAAPIILNSTPILPGARNTNTAVVTPAPLPGQTSQIK